MKGILQFDLDSADDRTAHLRAVKSLELTIAIHDIINLFRKFEHDETMDYDTCERVKEEIMYVLTREGIDIDKLLC